MHKDEIVEAIRAERAKLVEEHGPDLKTFAAWLREQENDRSGVEVVSFPPRQPEPAPSNVA